MPLPASTARPWRRIATSAKRLVVICVGFALCGGGLVMLVLPGPGILVVFLGLLVLSTEYSWAERALERSRHRAVDATSRLHTSRAARVGAAMSAAALITGGAAVAVVLDTYRYFGLGALVAGLGTLAILLPATRRLVDRATPQTGELDPVDPIPVHPSHTVKGPT